MITPTAREDDDDKKLGFAPDVGVEERIGGDDAVVHEQAMPEGPTVYPMGGVGLRESSI